MITVALLGFLTSTSAEVSPFWATNLMAKAQPMLLAKAKPLTHGRIQSVFKSLGYDDYDCFSTRIVGDSRRFVVGIGNAWQTCAFSVEPSGRLKPIIVDNEDDSCLVQDAQKIGGTLVLGGLRGWYGNGARYGLQTFKRKNDTWYRTSAATTEHECWGLTVRPRILRGALVEMQSRDYPKSMNACHATAQSAKLETFRLIDGRIRRVGERRMNTAFNRLDDLAGALDVHKLIVIRQIVPLAKLRKRVLQVWNDVGSNPSIECVRSICTSDASTYGWTGTDGKPIWFHFAKRSGQWVLARVDRREG